MHHQKNWKPNAASVSSPSPEPGKRCACRGRIDTSVGTSNPPAFCMRWVFLCRTAQDDVKIRFIHFLSEAGKDKTSPFLPREESVSLAIDRQMPVPILPIGMNNGYDSDAQRCSVWQASGSFASAPDRTVDRRSTPTREPNLTSIMSIHHREPMAIQYISVASPSENASHG